MSVVPHLLYGSLDAEQLLQGSALTNSSDARTHAQLCESRDATRGATNTSGSGDACAGGDPDVEYNSGAYVFFAVTAALLGACAAL